MRLTIGDWLIQPVARTSAMSCGDSVALPHGRVRPLSSCDDALVAMPITRPP
jgi:hypothetical protein